MGGEVGRGGGRLGLALSGLLVLLCLVPCLASATLPDGRAWEMVSPLNKNGGEINGINGAEPNEGLPQGGVIEAAENGDAITYESLIAFPGTTPGEEPQGAPLASQYLSTRKPGEWSSQDITLPTNSKVQPASLFGAPYRAFSSDLSTALVQRGGERPLENPILTEDAPPRYINFYFRDSATGAYTAVLKKPPVETPEEFQFSLAGFAEDGTNAVFESEEALTPEATKQSEGNLYEWFDGHLEPINVPVTPVHSGKTANGRARLGAGQDESHAISNDGSHVVWTQPQTSHLFDRVGVGTGIAKTIQLDRSQDGSDPGERGIFQTASDDGDRVFFTDERRLTPDATAGESPGREDLYLFDVESEHLTDLTVDGIDEGGAAVQGVLGASADGATVYFLAEGAIPGTSAIAGNKNLYMWHEGELRFLVALSVNDGSNGENYEPTVAHDWERSAGIRTARVSADGQHLLFMSQAKLTSYNNDDERTNRPDEEVYLYDADANAVTCVSCNPSGGRPIGPSGFPGGSPTKAGAPEVGAYQSRTLSDDAERVFFDSKNAIVPQDTNGAQDVYEWEQDGTGSCSATGGCVYLLSGGSSTSDSSFVDASANGNDAFFITRAQLVGQDTDDLRDLYDARVGGGFAEPPPPPAPCDGESCLTLSAGAGQPAPPVSSTFVGAGNLLASAAPPAPPPAKPLTRAQRLAKALSACKREPRRRKRAGCTRAARKKFGALGKQAAKGTVSR